MFTYQARPERDCVAWLTTEGMVKMVNFGQSAANSYKSGFFFQIWRGHSFGCSSQEKRLLQPETAETAETAEKRLF